MQKGQAAAEMLIIVAVSLVVLIAIFSVNSQSMVDLNRQKLVDEAKTSLATLSMAAEDVYYQGVGAKKKVYYSVPSGVDEGESGIIANSFVLTTLGSGVYSKPDVCLQGALPTAIGGHWVWLTAREDCVFVGIENIAADKTSSYVTLSQNDSAQDTIAITNGGSESATVFLVKTWGHSDVNLDIGSEVFSLAPSAQQQITLTYSSTATASGNYTGALEIGASIGAVDENTSIPVNAEVVVPESRIAVFPAARTLNLQGGGTDNNSFQACNNSDSLLGNISFSGTGDIANWISGIPTIPALAAGECQTVDYNLTVPGGQGAGTYVGSITASSSGYSDSMQITVNVTSQSSNFNFSWGTAKFKDSGKDLVDWTIENTGSDTITITRMKVRKWSENDLDNAKLSKIKLNNSKRWDDTAGDEDAWLDISTDFDIPAGTSYSAKNKLEFTKKINDDGEDFYIVFEFSDGSAYTTTIYNP